MKAIIVCGPESAGNRLMCRLLIKAGCYGSCEHKQPWDVERPTGSPIVWRRSVPHGDVKKDRDRFDAARLGPLLSQLVTWGYYDIKVIVIMREWHALAQSQVAREHARTYGRALYQIRRACLQIFEDLRNFGPDFRVVNYEALVLAADAVLVPLYEWAGLTIPDERVEVTNENAKHYGDRA